MYRLLYKDLRFIARTTTTTTTTPWLTLYQSLKFLSTTQDQLTVSYLVNSCGLSLESAKSASKSVNFKTLDQPNSVLFLFKSYGFSQPHISKLVKRHPRALLCNPEKTLAPKLEFLRSIGLTDPEISKLVSSYPSVLGQSLENRISRNYDFLRSALCSDSHAIEAMKLQPSLLRYDLENVVPRVVNLLRDSGMPEQNIRRMIHFWPRIFCMSEESVRRVAEKALELGIDSSKYAFSQAIVVLAGLTKSTWMRKLEVFRKWGLSEDQVLEAFRCNPTLMGGSEQKILAIMEFLVNELGLEASLVLRNSVLLELSLEKRLIPRASVLKYLVSKGMLTRRICPAMFQYSNERFQLMFISCYDEAPKLLKLFNGKCNTSHGKKGVSTKVRKG